MSERFKRFLFTAILVALILMGIINELKKKNRNLTPSNQQKIQVITGLDVLANDSFRLLKGKRIGLIINHSALSSTGKHILELIHPYDDIQVKVIFTPEHGFQGMVPAGEEVEDGVEPLTGAPIISLYGDNKKPPIDLIKGLDYLVYDIQGLGLRFYTYESTLAYCMEAAAEAGITFIVLDRPDPLTGTYVQGPVLKPDFSSFVGLFPIPIRHGLTMGELASMIRGEGWIKKASQLNLQVVKLVNWKRDLWYDELNLPWINPSPNIQSLEIALAYAGTCLMEGTNLSEGRGTDKPFLKIGAPYIDSLLFASQLNQLQLPGVYFHPVRFTPQAIEGVVNHPKYEGKSCGGIQIQITDREEYNPLKVALYIIYFARKLYPNEFEFKANHYIDLLYGSATLRTMILQGKKPEEIMDTWTEELKQFLNKRSHYLLY